MDFAEWDGQVRAWITRWGEEFWAPAGDDPEARARAEEVAKELLAPECRLIGLHPSEPDEAGFEDVLPGLRGVQLAAPNVTMEVGEGDVIVGPYDRRKAVVFFRMRGDHTLGPEGPLPTPQAVDARGVCELTFDDQGRVRVLCQYFDATVPQKQMGLGDPNLTRLKESDFVGPS